MKLLVLTLGRKKLILVNQLIHLDLEDFFGLGLLMACFPLQG
jgi:hypothetical protein